MRNYILLLLACLFLSACTKRTGNTTEQQLRTENFKLMQENDSLKRLLARDAAAPIKPDTLSNEPDPATAADPGALKLTGKHALTLQWISWDFPGSVMITQAGNEWYTITGEQIDRKNSRNYLKINGKIKPLSERELEFDGIIETKVETINGGKPCIRNGRKLFKATGTRKYWRLQDMINCEGGMVTDYVDIYF